MCFFYHLSLSSWHTLGCDRCSYVKFILHIGGATPSSAAPARGEGCVHGRSAELCEQIIKVVVVVIGIVVVVAVIIIVVVIVVVVVVVIVVVVIVVVVVVVVVLLIEGTVLLL